MSRNTSKAIQQFRGTTEQHKEYVGPIGELTVDTTKKTVVVQDGVTKGGNPVALEKRQLVSTASFLKVNNKTSGTLAEDNVLNWDMEGFLDSLATYVGVLPDFNMPGVIVAFSGQFGGEGNRYPIPEDADEPDTNWVLCDGIETDGVAVPDLRGRMIIGASDNYPLGESGGSDVGQTDASTLSASQGPVHAHTTYVLAEGPGGGSANSWYVGEKNHYTYTTGTTSSGSGESHSHNIDMPPYYALAFIKQIRRTQGMRISVPDVNFEREELFTSDKTTITIPEGMRVRVGEKVLVTPAAETLNLDIVASAEERKGKDVYLYACQPSAGYKAAYVLSMNSTVPDGYNAENSRKIGGFHCLCADAGELTNKEGTIFDIDEVLLSGFKAGEILPASRWDLRHRPRSISEGMVFDERLNLWVDIYLGSWTPNGYGIIRSVFGGNYTTICSGSQSISGEGWDSYLAKVKKRLPTRFEFVNFALNSNKNTNIAGSANPSTTGGHVDTAGRRMISYIGVEDCCGVLWQWTSDLFEGGSYGSLHGSELYLGGYSWNMGTNSVGHSGSAYGFLRRALVGGLWSDGSYCGRRCVHCGDASADVHATIGGRGVSEPRVWGSDVV